LSYYAAVVIWSLVWLDKQGFGRHDDGSDAGSSAAAAGNEDELTPYAEKSATDTGNLVHIIQ